MSQQKFQKKKVGFGEALLLEVHFHSAGLKPLTDAIRSAVGEHIGTRNTFAKLYDMAELPDGPKDRYRAWLLLTALGQEPGAWGIGDDAVPPSTDQNTLRRLLIAACGCLRGTAGPDVDCVIDLRDAAPASLSPVS